MTEYIARYRPMETMAGDLLLGECTVHRCSEAGKPSWWLLWLCATRETDGAEARYCVPVSPGGDFGEGPGGKTWGLRRFELASGVWRVSPSVNVLLTKEVHPGVHEEIGSQWHKNVVLVEVLEGETWQTEAP